MYVDSDSTRLSCTDPGVFEDRRGKSSVQVEGEPPLVKGLKIPVTNEQKETSKWLKLK